jgi:hypothetical protein
MGDQGRAGEPRKPLLGALGLLAAHIVRGRVYDPVLNAVIEIGGGSVTLGRGLGC